MGTFTPVLYTTSNDHFLSISEMNEGNLSPGS